MGKFDGFTVDNEAPEGGATRGLDAEDMQEANKAIEDGMFRHWPATPELEASAQAIKRYLAKEGWGCKLTMSKGKIHWRVVAKKELTEEHKATLQAALKAAREKKAAEKATTGQPEPEGQPGPESPPENPPEPESQSQSQSQRNGGQRQKAGARA